MKIRKKHSRRRLNPDKKKNLLMLNFFLSAKTLSSMYSKVVLFQDMKQTIPVSISKSQFKTRNMEKAIESWGGGSRY